MPARLLCIHARPLSPPIPGRGTCPAPGAARQSRKRARLRYLNDSFMLFIP